MRYKCKHPMFKKESCVFSIKRKTRVIKDGEKRSYYTCRRCGEPLHLFTNDQVDELPDYLYHSYEDYIKYIK